MNKKCQVFTPDEIAIRLLDIIGYNDNLFGQKVLENACGDGRILTQIVKRYIENCLKNNRALSQIKEGLKQDICGVEIDKEHYNTCHKELDLVASKYGLYNVEWNLLNKDALSIDSLVDFDFVIGNPPYITYREIDEKIRPIIREKYNVCQEGKFDYCYAFIEASINSLSDTGKMVYLIPNSIFKTVFAQNLREFILQDLIEIYDYTTQRLFEQVLTSSAIISIKKNSNNDIVQYHDIVKNKDIEINKSNLKAKWIFTQAHESSSGQRFGDFFKVSNTIATLLNEVFVLSDFTENDEYILLKSEEMIEKSITRPTASPKTLNLKKTEKIIFPYFFQGDDLTRYHEDDLKKHFPYAYQYLIKRKEKLLNRKSDDKALWYEYGRTQAIAHMNKNKVLLSTLVTNDVHIYKLDKENIPYSGIYIEPIEKYTLQDAVKILTSNDFYKYVEKIGINASGSSKRITTKDIAEFRFCEEVLL